MGSWLQEGSARLFVHTRVAPAPLPWGALVRACSPGAVLLHARSSPGGLGCASGAVHGAVSASGHASLNAGRLRAGWRSKDGDGGPGFLISCSSRSVASGIFHLGLKHNPLLAHPCLLC